MYAPEYSDIHAAGGRSSASAPRQWRCLRARPSSPSRRESSEPRAGRPSLPERLPSRIARTRSEVFFYAQKLIVFRDAVGAAGRSGLDLTGAGGHREVGNESVLGFTRPVRHHRRIARVGGHFHGFERLRERADLVHFYQDRVGYATLDAHRQPLSVGHEEIVAHQLNLFAQHVGELLPAVPVIFGQSVFDRNDGVLTN